MRELRTAALAVLAVTVVLGLGYPLAMTAVAQVAFPGRADGSLVERDGRIVGSRLVGQDFRGDPRYFQSRPSVTGYAADATYFNNLGPNQRDLAGQLRELAREYVRRERPYTPDLTAGKVPADAATTSASGIDPHISEENARIQANRVAPERGLPLDRVLALADDHASRPFLGLGGPRSVNVLELNLALDEVAS